MELRTLRYFLALTEEGTISGAAKALHVTQPTLSRQLSDLEKEFGKRLFERGSKRIKLTEDGARLRDYARSIVLLADKATSELAQPAHAIAGDVFVGCGESDAMRIVLRAMKQCQAEHPNIRFHLFSGTSSDLNDRFNDGLLDFIVEFELAAHMDCDFVALPAKDTWGVLMRKDDPLASHNFVAPADLVGRRVIGSRQGIKSGKMREWMGDAFDSINVVLTYNLVGNAALAVEEGLGIAVAYDKLVRLSSQGVLCFRPLNPPLSSDVGLIWKRHRRLSAAALAFLEALKSECSRSEIPE